MKNPRKDFSVLSGVKARITKQVPSSHYLNLSVTELCQSLLNIEKELQVDLSKTNKCKNYNSLEQHVSHFIDLLLIDVLCTS